MEEGENKLKQNYSPHNLKTITQSHLKYEYNGYHKRSGLDFLERVQGILSLGTNPGNTLHEATGVHGYNSCCPVSKWGPCNKIVGHK